MAWVISKTKWAFTPYELVSMLVEDGVFDEEITAVLEELGGVGVWEYCLNAEFPRERMVCDMANDIMNKDPPVKGQDYKAKGIIYQWVRDPEELLE